LALTDMDGLALLEVLQSRCGSKMPPVVVYTGRPLSKAEAQRLEAYTEAIVIKEGPAAERLHAEIRLFVERFRRGLPARGREKQSARVSTASLAGRKVLVVDDDMRTVYALSALLRAKGVQVFVAENGRVALAMLDQHPDAELVLMDLMMPEMDGYEAIRKVRADRRFATLPIVALTAKAMRGDREKCFEAGANDYLAKPIDPVRLFEVLQALLPPPEKAREASSGAVHGA
jgi:CheY-like chemotaxis protein